MAWYHSWVPRTIKGTNGKAMGKAEDGTKGSQDTRLEERSVTNGIPDLLVVGNAPVHDAHGRSTVPCFFLRVAQPQACTFVGGQLGHKSHTLCPERPALSPGCQQRQALCTKLLAVSPERQALSRKRLGCTALVGCAPPRPPSFAPVNMNPQKQR